VETVRALAGQLVPLTAGRHTVRQDLVVWDALTGAVVGLVALVLAIGWVALGDRARGRRRAGAARQSVG
jgi:hypothetical protein